MIIFALIPDQRSQTPQTGDLVDEPVGSDSDPDVAQPG
jgi:hypothetical protein